MTITHHPSDMTLAAFAAGTLDEGRALVVSTHLVGCPVCRGAVRTFEQARGVMLQDALPVAMAADALERALRAISADASEQQFRSDAVEGQGAYRFAAYPLGPWRRIGGGLRWRSVGVPAEQGTRVFMLKAAPGIRIPHHAHAGIEWTCVLQGAFRHDLGRYGAGDFDEADEAVEHRPVVEDDEECICLVALQGQIQLKGWVGRLVQPFVRF
jgi:putative transcriptional regulator